MRPHVCFQTGFMPERLATDKAGKRPFARVLSSMKGEAVVLRECLTAVLTPVRPLAAVNHRVSC